MCARPSWTETGWAIDGRKEVVGGTRHAGSKREYCMHEERVQGGEAEAGREGRSDASGGIALNSFRLVKNGEMR